MPQEQQEKMLTMIENNPDLFMKISKEVKEKMKKDGKDQMTASMIVMQKYQKELKAAMESSGMQK